MALAGVAPLRRPDAEPSEPRAEAVPGLPPARRPAVVWHVGTVEFALVLRLGWLLSRCGLGFWRRGRLRFRLRRYYYEDKKGHVRA